MRPLNDEFAIIIDQVCAAFCVTPVHGGTDAEPNPVEAQAPPLKLIGKQIAHKSLNGFLLILQVNDVGDLVTSKNIFLIGFSLLLGQARL